MASTQEIVELLFKADYKGQPQMMKLKKDVSGLASSFDAGVSRVAAFTLALGAIETAALGAAVGLAKAGAESAGKFKDSFNEISTLITDISDDDLAGFETAIKNYASNSTASLESINTAIYNAISSGTDWKNSLELLTTAEKLSVAGKADLNDTVKVLTATLNAYGESADAAGDYSDVLFNTVKNGVTTLPELSSQLGQITGIAASLNIPFDELSAVIATLTANGLSTSGAITAIKGALTNIIKPTQSASDAAQSLGIGFDYAALQSKGFSGLMADISEKSKGNTEQVTKLFGSVEGLNAALSLTSENGAQTFIDKLADLQDSTGATENAFQKMVDNTALIKQTLANNLELTLVDIGTPILDEFSDIDLAINDIFKTIRNNLSNDSTLGAVTTAVEAVAGTVASIIRNMADNLDDALATADLSGFTGAFESINAALKDLNLESPEGLSQAIETLGDSFGGLTKFSIGALDVLTDLIDFVGDAATYVSGLDSDTVTLIGTLGGMAIAISAVSAVVSPLIAVLAALKKAGGVAGALGSAGEVSKMAKAIKAVGVAGAASGTGFVLGEWLAEASDSLLGWTDSISTAADEAGPEMVRLFEAWKAETGNMTATFDDYTAAMVKKRQAEEDSNAAVSDLTDSQAALDGATSAVPDDKIDSWKKYGDVVLDADGNIVSFAKASDEVGGALTKQGTALDKNAGSLEKLGKNAKQAKDDLKAIDVLKLSVGLESDRVKAEAEKVKAIMDSLGKSSVAVAESIGEGFKAIGGDNFAALGLIQQNDVIDSLKLQAESQSKLASAQEKVANAQAVYMQAKAKQMASGKGLIQIDGTRLEPELEAFMLRIIEFTQIRLAEEQSGFLLGIESL